MQSSDPPVVVGMVVADKTIATKSKGGQQKEVAVIGGQEQQQQTEGIGERQDIDHSSSTATLPLSEQKYGATEHTTTAVKVPSADPSLQLHEQQLQYKNNDGYGDNIVDEEDEIGGTQQQQQQQEGGTRQQQHQQVLDEERIQKDMSINPEDILCGRNKLSFNHVGNKYFREAIAASLEEYMTKENRFEKSFVVHRIVDQIHSRHGRFLKQNTKTGQWFELTQQQAREKVGHAIRDAAAVHVAKQQQMYEQQQHQQEQEQRLHPFMGHQQLPVHPSLMTPQQQAAIPDTFMGSGFRSTSSREEERTIQHQPKSLKSPPPSSSITSLKSSSKSPDATPAASTRKPTSLKRHRPSQKQHPSYEKKSKQPMQQHRGSMGSTSSAAAIQQLLLSSSDSAGSNGVPPAFDASDAAKETASSLKPSPIQYSRPFITGSRTGQQPLGYDPSTVSASTTSRFDPISFAAGTDTTTAATKSSGSLASLDQYPLQQLQQSRQAKMFQQQQQYRYLNHPPQSPTEPSVSLSQQHHHHHPRRGSRSTALNVPYQLQPQEQYVSQQYNNLPQERRVSFPINQQQHQQDFSFSSDTATTLSGTEHQQPNTLESLFGSPAQLQHQNDPLSSSLQLPVPPLLYTTQQQQPSDPQQYNPLLERELMLFQQQQRQLLQQQHLHQQQMYNYQRLSQQRLQQQPRQGDDNDYFLHAIDSVLGPIDPDYYTHLQPFEDNIALQQQQQMHEQVVSNVNTGQYYQAQQQNPSEDEDNHPFIGDDQKFSSSESP